MRNERLTMTWKVIDTKTDEIVGTEACPGNASELAMVLTEMKGSRHKVVEVEDE